MTSSTDVVQGIEVGTPIQNKYTFWCYRSATGAGKAKVDYIDATKPIGSFSTVEGFWQVYDHIVRPNDFKTSADYHLFKEGVKPTWEDPQNKQGGKWMVRLKTKGLTSRYWEELVLAIVGEQFDVGHEVCGAVVSVRHNEDIISVWNKNADHAEATTKIRDQMKRLLNLPASITIEYKKHVDAKADGSSFRNPSVVYKVPVSGNDKGGRGFGGRGPTPAFGGNTFSGRGMGAHKTGDSRDHYQERGHRERDHDGGYHNKQPWGKPNTSSGDPTKDKEDVEKNRGWDKGSGRDGGGSTFQQPIKSVWGSKPTSTGDPARDAANALASAGNNSSFGQRSFHGQAASGALGPPKFSKDSDATDKKKLPEAALVWARATKSIVSAPET